MANWTIIETATGKVLAQLCVPDDGFPSDVGWEWDSATQTAVLVDRQGDPAIEQFDTVSQAWVPDIEKAKVALLARISSSFYSVLAQGCASPKGWVDCDDKAQARVTSAVSLMREAAALQMAPETLSWTMFDKSAVPHTVTDLVALGIAIGFRTQALFGAKQALEGAVEAATSIDDLDAIDIAGAWPS